MNKAIIQLHDAIPLHKWGPGTGIINQCHDSIVVECPEHAAQEVAGLMEECMNMTHPLLPRVIFSASADIGMSWKDVG
jgi:DNA polymerase I-like protein with 3'-5' exonuclease and polymerase domains